MKAALALENVSNVPDEIMAEMYYRMQLGNGSVAGSSRTHAGSAEEKRRSNFVRVRSTYERQRRNGSIEEVGTSPYGTAQHYALVYVGGQARVFAYIACVISSADRLGKRGLTEKRLGMECFSSYGGARRYVNALAVEAVIGTLFRDGKHFVYSRDRSSGDGS